MATDSAPHDNPAIGSSLINAPSAQAKCWTTPNLALGQPVQLKLTQEARIISPDLEAWFISYDGIVFGNKTPTLPGWLFTLAFSCHEALGPNRKQFYVAINDPVTPNKDGEWQFPSDDETCKVPVFSPAGTHHEIEIISFTNAWVTVRLIK